MNQRLRILAFGLVSGVLLSLLRAPRGLDWTQLPATDGTTAALFRAGALAAVALLLDRRRPAFRGELSSGLLLVASGAGYALHGLVLIGLHEPESRIAFGLCLIGGTFVLLALAGGGLRPHQAVAEEPGPDPLLARAGLLLTGAGVAITLENLALQLRQFGLGLPEDDTVMGLVFLLTVSVGALAFGGLVRGFGHPRLAASLAVGIAGAATLQGLRFLGGLGREPLWNYLARFGLDHSDVGTWQATGWLSATTWVIAGFLLGAGVAAARSAARLSMLLFGAALGLLLRPAVVRSLSETVRFPEGLETPWAWRVALVGVGVAAGGAVLVALAENGRARLAGIAVALATVLIVAVSPVATWSFSPWYRVDLEARLAVPTATGLVVLENLPTGAPIVTVDRKRVTPTPREEDLDDRRILWAWSLLGDELRQSGDASVLLIGQLTHRRADLLRRLPIRRLERTSPWFEAQRELDDALLPLGADGHGELIPPGEARRRIHDGSYDLVLAFPTHGPILSLQSARILPWGITDAPALANLDLPEGTLGVAWLPALSPLAPRTLGDDVLVAVDELREAWIGVVRGQPGPWENPDDPPLLFAGGGGGPRPSPLEILDTLPWNRDPLFPEAVLETIAVASAASEGTRAPATSRGLAEHFAAQEISSPFENLAQATEITEESLKAFTQALRDDPGMDPFTRVLWGDLAALLTEKRMPDFVLVFVEAVSEAYPPWPALDRAVGKAYLEFLQPEDALVPLQRGVEFDPDDVGLLVLLAEAAREAGRPAVALGPLRAAIERRPDRRELRRALAITLHAAGDAEAEALLDALLVEDPEDAELARIRRPGPVPQDGE